MPRRNTGGTNNLLRNNNKKSHAGTTTSTSNSSNKSKIVIRPYSKPPSLPADYYDKTVSQLLQGTLQSLQQQLDGASHHHHQYHSLKTTTTTSTPTIATPDSNSNNNKNDTSSSNNNNNNTSLLLNSLQTSYTAVVTLVRHQYGPRLYADWMQSLQQAVETVLPDNNNNNNNNNQNTTTSAAAAAATTTSNNNKKKNLLHSIPAAYQVFTDYLLVCKHVFLALDRTHVWHAVEQQAVAAVGSNNINTNNTSNSNAGGGMMTMMWSLQQQTMWSAGLAQFRARMASLGLEQELYREWMEALLRDWHGSSSNTNTATNTTSTSDAGGWQRSQLQAVWYMWQDLGLVGSIASPLPLQQDLEQHWRRQGQEQWEQCISAASSVSSSSSSADGLVPAARFLQSCMQQHDHVTNWRPWLPVPWLWHILDVHVLQPVLHDGPDGLLHPRQLHPLLEQEVFRNENASSRTFGPLSAKTTAAAAGAAVAIQQQQQQRIMPVQQLWMLAGRLPGGQQDVAGAICTFAKTQGLQRLQQQQQQQQSPQQSGGTTPLSNSGPNQQGNNNSNNTQAVSDLLNLQECLTAMVNSLQPGGPDLISFKSVWEEVVNAGSSLAEPLAKFLDQMLRSHMKMDLYANRTIVVAAAANSNNSMITPHSASHHQRQDEWLQRILSGLFVPLQAKDVFEAFYKRDLAKRLLWNRIVSMDVEKQVCSLLKAECGAGYTSKMEGMFQDIDLSRESMLVYKQALLLASSGPQKPNGVEMEVQILTTGYWPVYPQYPNLNLPTQLQELQEHFDAHYTKKCQGRRITWQYALGHCIVKTNGFSKQYELVVSLCQALVLVQFSSSDSKWSLPALMQAIGLDDREEMERILQSLALGKEGTRILRKLDYDVEPGKRKKIRMNVDDRDQFVIQQSFTSNQRRIRITNIMMKETKEEREKTVEGVSRDRLYLIDAVLVRIMKARKSIMHQNLMPQVLEQLKFPAQPSDVKMRVESLIEREYMERDAKDRNRYNYLA